MFKSYLLSFLETPQRLAAYAKRYPYSAVGYGALLLFSALFARIIITLAAGVVIVAGIYHIFGGSDGKD